MCKLREAHEWWTSLSTSHDERIMTAIVKQKQGQGAKQWQKAARIFMNWPAPKLAITFRAHECATMTERADACFSGPRLCWYIELFEFFCGSFRDLAHESCIEGANHVRGGVLKSTLVVDNDSVRFHSLVLVMCRLCSHSSQTLTHAPQ